MDTELTKEQRKLLLQSGLPRIFLDATLLTFDPKVYKNELSFVYNYSKNYEKCKKAGKGISFCGDYGVGKTYMVSAICIWLMKEKQSFRYYTLHDLVEWYDTKGEIENGLTFWEIMNTIDVLVIDDLNIEVSDDRKTKAGDTRISLSDKTDKFYRAKIIKVLEHILLTRMNNGKLVFVVTSIRPSYFSKALSERLKVLINRMTEVLLFKTTVPLVSKETLLIEELLKEPVYDK